MGTVISAVERWSCELAAAILLAAIAAGATIGSLSCDPIAATAAFAATAVALGCGAYFVGFWAYRPDRRISWRNQAAGVGCAAITLIFFWMAFVCAIRTRDLELQRSNPPPAPPGVQNIEEPPATEVLFFYLELRNVIARSTSDVAI